MFLPSIETTAAEKVEGARAVKDNGSGALSYLTVAVQATGPDAAIRGTSMSCLSKSPS